MAERLPKIGVDVRQPRRRSPNAFVDSGAPGAGRAFRAVEVVPSPYGNLPPPTDGDLHRNPGSATACSYETPVVADVFGFEVPGFEISGSESEVVRTIAENPK